MSKFSDFGFVALKTFCATIAITTFVATFYTAGPALETRFWPVVSKVRIQTLETTPEGWTKVRVSFTKYRNCDYLGMAWFVGERPSDFERVAVSVQRDPSDTGSPNRPLGTQRAGPWTIFVSEKDFRTKTFAQLQHRCWPFWNSVTEFYP